MGSARASMDAASLRVAVSLVSRVVRLAHEEKRVSWTQWGVQAAEPSVESYAQGPRAGHPAARLDAGWASSALRLSGAQSSVQWGRTRHASFVSWQGGMVRCESSCMASRCMRRQLAFRRLALTACAWAVESFEGDACLSCPAVRALALASHCARLQLLWTGLARPH